MFLKSVPILGLLALLICPAMGQILNDSARQLYGPSTSRFFLEQDLKRNRDTLHYLDTVIDRLYKVDWVDQGDKKYQDLGALGTPLKPIFMQLPSQIGARSGYEGYTPYYQNGSDLKHFNSQSPFTNLYIMFGELGRNIVEANFTRNVNPQWNVGADIRNMSVLRQIGLQARNSDRQIESYQYDFYSSWRTKDFKYYVMGSFSRWLHNNMEPGGVDSLLSNVYDYERATVHNRLAYSEDVRQQYHVYQQYKFNDLFQVYHTFDKYRQNNYYYHKLSDEGDYYGDEILLLTDSTKERSIFRYVMNEVGLKGGLGKINYRLGYRRRDGRAPLKYLDVPNVFQENYLLGYGRFDFAPMHMIELDAEFLLGGQYQVDLRYYNRWLDFHWTRKYYQPSFLEQRYFGNHDYWDNGFVNTLADKFVIKATAKTGPVTWMPMADLTLLDDYVFWNTEEQPEQTEGFGQIMTLGGKVNLKLGAFRWDNEVLYSTLSGAASRSVAVPELFVNSELYFQGTLFQDALYLKAGIGAHTWSPYFRYGYDPVIQQFHLQNTVDTPGYYPLLDAFAVLNIGPANVIFRANNLITGLFEDLPGYQTTAEYPGLPRRIDLGVRWYMYN